MKVPTVNVLSQFSKLFQSFRFGEKQELKAKLARHHRIFSSSHSAHGYGYFDWDLAQKRIIWSGGYWRHMGYTEEEIDYISLSDNYYDYIHQDDVSRVKGIVLGLLKTPGPRELCYRVRSKEGKYIWTEVRCDASWDEKTGYVSYISGIVMDVTQQRQMEEALKVSVERNRRILRSTNDGIWEWSAAGNGLHFVMRCWEQIGFKYPDDLQEDMEKEGFDNIEYWCSRIHPDDLAEHDLVLSRHIRGEAPFDVEYRIRAKDDSWRWIRARGQMEFDELNRPTRVCGTNVDITEIKRAEERVIKAKEQAERANRAKSEFLSRMSHELRTPLNAILGFAQLLQYDSNLTVQQKDNIAEIQGAGHHLLELVGDILDLSRIETGKMTFSMERLEPIALLEECITFLQPQADSRGIIFSLQDSGLRDFGVTADCVRVKQIFLNLLSNAVKYNREYGRVDIVCSENIEGVFRIEVSDTGLGIPKQREREVFEPFSRLGAELSNIEGTGVGLVITRQLVTQMGGEIGFRNHDDEGCTFWIDLPVGEKGGLLHDKSANIAVSLDQYADVEPLTFTKEKKILYVEDNASNQRFMTQLFDRLPTLSLTIAEDAYKGLYCARTEKPDMIIMDIHLPGMDGFEALDVLKSDLSTADIPVIALSANAMAHDLEKGEDAGFLCYLTKPIDLNQLIRTFNEVLLEKVDLLGAEAQNALRGNTVSHEQSADTA